MSAATIPVPMEVEQTATGELATAVTAASAPTPTGAATMADPTAPDNERSDSDAEQQAAMTQQQQQHQQQGNVAAAAPPPLPPTPPAAVAASLTPKAAVSRSKSSVEPAPAPAQQKPRRVLKDPARAEAAAARRKRRKLEEEEAAMTNGAGGGTTGRQTSTRGGGGGSFGGPSFDGGLGAGGSDLSVYSSSAALPISATASGSGARLPVVVLVPGSDSIKIGLSDAARPYFFRNVVAYSVPTATLPDAEGRNGAGGGSSATEQHTDLGLRSAAAAAKLAVATPADIVTEAELSDEEEVEAELTLQATDRALLARWRKKREADHVAAEKLLRKRGKGTGTAAAAAVAGTASSASSGLIQPAVGADGREESIHDATHQQSATVDSGNRPRTLFAPALLETAAVAAAGASAAGSTSYLPRHPIVRGHLNVGPSRPLRQCFSQLEDVLHAALRSCLNLSPSDYSRHGVSMAVPDCWGPREIAECAELLLVRMGFRELFLHRESVLTCYGAGLASACVVDVGAERSRVVCVEDGVVLPRAAIELNYGGRDVDALLEASIGDKTFWSRVDQARAGAKDKSQADLMQLDHRERIRRWKEKFAYCIKSDEEETTTMTAEAALAGGAAGASAAAPVAAPASVPTELTLGAALAPLGLFHPSLFPSDLRLRSATQRTALRSAEGLDTMADRFIADSHFYHHTAAGIAAAAAAAATAATAAATAAAAAGTATNATVVPPAATAVLFNRAMLDEEVVLTGEGGVGKRRGRKKALVADSGVTASGASPAKPAAPFKLDRRRKDHQALLLQYTEEQLLAGAHLEPAEPAPTAADGAGAGGAVDPSSSDASLSSSSLTPAESFITARLSLQQAVAACLRALPGLELQTKLASTIVLAGGSCRLPHLAAAFEERLVDCVPYVVPGVNTVNCLWMTREEWKRFGAKLLREKAPFPW